MQFQDLNAQKIHASRERLAFKSPHAKDKCLHQLQLGPEKDPKTSLRCFANVCLVDTAIPAVVEKFKAPFSRATHLKAFQLNVTHPVVQYMYITSK